MSRDSGMQKIELNAGEHLQPVWFKDSNTALGIKNKFKFAEKVLIVGGSNDRQIDLREHCKKGQLLEQDVEEELKQLDVDKIKPKMRDIRGKNPTVKQTLSISNKVETNSSVNSKKKGRSEGSVDDLPPSKFGASKPQF